MARIVLAFGGRPGITAHDSVGLALLLTAIAAPAGPTLAEKLERHAAAGGEIDLGGAEQEALLEALEELRAELLPDRLLSLRRELLAELGLGGRTA